MTTPLPGDVVLWSGGDLFPAGIEFSTRRPRECSCDADPEHGPHVADGGSIREYRARLIAADDAVLGVLAAARAVEVATRPAADAPDMGRCLRAEAMAALDALFKALGEVEKHNAPKTGAEE